MDAGWTRTVLPLRLQGAADAAAVRDGAESHTSAPGDLVDSHGVYEALGGADAETDEPVMAPATSRAATGEEAQGQSPALLSACGTALLAGSPDTRDG